MEKYYTTKEIAKILGVTSITIRRWIAKGELPAIYLGTVNKEYRVSQTAFDKFLKDRKVKQKK